MHRGGLGGVSQFQHRAQSIAQIAFGNAASCASKDAVQAQTDQAVFKNSGAALELDRVPAVVEGGDGLAGDSGAASASEGIVSKTRGIGAADRSQLVAGVPGVGPGAVVGEVAVGVVALGGGDIFGQPVGGVVLEAGDCRGQLGSSPGAANAGALACGIVGVAQGALHTGVGFLVADSRELVGVVVAVDHTHAIGQGELSGPVGGVVGEADALFGGRNRTISGANRLGDTDQAHGIVVLVGDGAAAGGGQALAGAVGIVGIADRALRGCFLGDAIKAVVVAAGDQAIGAVVGLEQAIGGVVLVADGAGDRLGVTGLRPSPLPHHRTCGFPHPAVGTNGLLPFKVLLLVDTSYAVNALLLHSPLPVLLTLGIHQA